MRRGLRETFRSALPLLQTSVMGTAVPLAFGVVVSVFLFLRYRDDIETLQNQYRTEQDSKTKVHAQQVQSLFQQVHQGLQTISNMPGIRRLDASTHRSNQFNTEWADDAFEGIEQIFLSLNHDHGVSQITVTPVEFDPEKTNPVTQKLWEPIAIFDPSTINQLNEVRWPQKRELQAGIETLNEYKAIRKQISFFKQVCPTKDRVALLDYPATMSEQVIIADNQIYRISHDDRDRQGFVYSVPYYGPHGNLRGVVSCIFLTKILRNHLPNGDTAIVDTKGHFAILRDDNGTAVKSAESVRVGTPDTSLEYSAVQPLNVPDMWGRWSYWVGKSSDEFWGREDVRLLRTTILSGGVVLWIGVVLLSAFLAFMRKRQDRRLEGLLRSSQEILFMTDNTGKVIRVGGQVKKTLGWDASDFIGVNLAFFVTESAREEFAEHLKLVTSREHATETAEFQIETFNDDFIWYEFTTANMSHLPEIGGVLISLRNVETRKHAELMLLTAKDAAESANEAKSEFLSRMSHELRTPLNAILGFGQLLEMSPETVKDQESVGQILKAGRHLLNLVNDILDISKIESGTITMSVEPIDCLDVVQTVVNFVTPQAAQSGVKIFVECDERLSALADRQRLVQVLINLCSNAIKYNRPSGEVHIAARYSSDEQVEFEIRDTGIGINPNVIDRLFTPFDRLGAERLTVEGTGLGLALSKTLIEAMSGRIDVSSTVGQGTVMRFLLPAARPELRLEINSAPPTPYSVVSMEPTRILYIEDNLSDLKLIADLEHSTSDFELHSVAHEHVSVERIESYLPEIVMIDLRSGDEKALEMLEKIRSNPQTANLKVIVFSVETDPETLERAIFLGADHIHSKPVDMDQLLQLLQHIADAA